MRMTGEQQIAAPRQRVWEALNDPAYLQACIPGCQSLEKEGDDKFNATAEIKIGPIGARFKGAVTLTELDPPNSYLISGQGSGGIAGSAKGGARVRLSDVAGGTLVSYEVDAEVGGRMAQLGGPIIDATAKQLAGKFFSKFGEMVAPSTSATSASPAQAATAPSAPFAPAAAFAPKTKGVPYGWVAALLAAVLAGVVAGHGFGGTGSSGLATGLLVIIVAGAGVEYGRRIAAPVVMLDGDSLRRLITGSKE